MRRNLEMIAVLCLTLSVASFLDAQEMVMLDRHAATAPTVFGETGLFQTMSGSTVDRGNWTFSTYLAQSRYTMAPAVELAPPSARAHEDMVVNENRFSASIGYGITDRWEVTLQLPLVSIQGNEGDRAGYLSGYPYVGKFANNGAGNLHFGTKLGLLRPSSRHDLAVTGFFDLDTGESENGIATGNPDFGIGLAWDRSVYYASGTYANRGRRDGGNTPEKLAFDVPDELRADIGVNIPINHLGATNWITEVNTIWYIGGERQPDDVVSLATGLRHWMGNTPWGFSAAIRANLSAAFGGSDTSGIGFVGGVHYAAVRVVSLAPPPLPPVPVPLPPPVPTPVRLLEPVAPPAGPRALQGAAVVFERNSTHLTNISKAQLDDVALGMRREPASIAVIIGYLDSSGTLRSAKDLDRRRAESLRDYLVSRHNLDSSRMTIEAGGIRSAPAENGIAVIKLSTP